MKIDVDSIIAQLELLGRSMRTAASRGINRTTAAMLPRLKERTRHPFQEVPSYLLEHRFRPDLNPTVYPPGTLATFAKKTGRDLRIGNLEVFTGSTEYPIQQYPEGGEDLHRLITRDAATPVSATEVEGSVGYPKIAEGPGYENIRYVMFGTRKMIPRPFLEDELRRSRTEFRNNLADEFIREMNDAGKRKRRSPGPLLPPEVRK